MATMRPEGNQKISSSAEAISWRVWLPRRRPVVSVLVAVFIMVLATAVYVSLGDLFYTLLTLIVLGAAVSAHYAPLHYTLNSEGITVNSMWGCQEKPWEKLQTYLACGDDGVSVGSSTRRSLLTRGWEIYLYYADNREAVLDYLVRHLRPAEQADDR